MRKIKMKIVIIGGGSAGTTCAFELRKLNKDVEITILENSSNTEYSPCALPYVLSEEIKKFEDIFIFSENDYTSNDIDLSLNSKVLNIDRKRKTINYKKNEKQNQINYDKLVLATGSYAFIPSIKEIRDTNYYTLKTIEDAKNIAQSIKKGSSSVVIGGGLIGIELAISLAKKGEKVIILEAKETIFYSILDADMSSKLKSYLEEENIIIYDNSFIKRISPGKLEFENKILAFDKLFFCTGVRANTFLAEKVKLDVNKGIIVNPNLQTSDSSIFACGDCVESIEFNSEKKILSQLGTIAVRQAKIIANNIVSEKKSKFPKVLNNTVTKIGNLFVASVGLTSQRCKELEIQATSAKYTGNIRSEYYPSESTITVKLICSKDGKVIGGQIIGEEEVVGRINTIALVIQRSCHINELVNLETCYNPASSPIFDPVTVAASICLKKLNSRRGL